MCVFVALDAIDDFIGAHPCPQISGSQSRFNRDIAVS